MTTLSHTIAGAAAAGAGAATVAHLAAGPSLAAVVATAAACVAVGAPWRAAADDSAGALAQGAGFVTGVGAAAAALGSLLAVGPAGTPALAAAGALAYLLLAWAALVGWTGAVGQGLATWAALALLALPYGAQSLLAPLPDGLVLDAVRHGPLAVLAGSFGGADVLRQGSLYERFDLAQALPFTYVEPWVALTSAAALAALGWGAARARSGWRPAPRALAVAVAVVALVGSPEPAAAQLFPAPSSASESAVGDLVTRVRLGYYVAAVSGNVRVDGRNGVPGSGTKLDFDSDLDLDPAFVLPTFEVALTWANGGRLWVQYVETVWQGEKVTAEAYRFDGVRFPLFEVADTRYHYRTVALCEAVDIPVSDFITLSVVSTQRYIRHETRIRAGFTTQKSSLEVILPGIGAGAEVLIYDMVIAYGDVQWLDFRTSILGGDDKEYTLKYREWRAGLRFMLVEHAHILAEWYSLQTIVKEGPRERYKQSLDGVRIQVSVLF